MKGSIFWFAVSVCLGIAAAKAVNIPFGAFFFAASLCCVLSIVCFRDKAGCAALLLLTAFFLGGVMLRSSQRLPRDHIYRFVPGKGGRFVSVEGIVDSDPVCRKDKITFALKADEADMGDGPRKVSGRVLVKLYEKKAISFGDRLSLKGSLARPYGFWFSRGSNYEEFLKRQGLYGVLKVREGASIKEIVPERRMQPVKRSILRIKGRFRRIISARMGPVQAGVLNALLLGDRSGLPGEIKDMLVKTGTVHVLAISGLHVGIVAILALILLRALRVPRKAAFILMIPVLLAYLLLTGSKTSIVRATIMGIILCLGYAFDREADIYNSLSLAALIILFINPQQLFDVGFQLSFASVLSIVYIAPKIKSLFPEWLRERRVTRPPLALLSVSCGAWLGVCPVVAYYFEVITPIAIFANILIVPYMGLVIASGFLCIMGSLISPALGSILSATSQLSVDLLIYTVRMFSRIPYAFFRVSNLSISSIVSYYSLLFFILKVLSVRKVLYTKDLRKL
ncbi:ComEC/Rec2 family competence protein [Candidatus Omnitrophota bacterium]